MNNPLYTNGMPDFNAVSRYFPTNEPGHLRHQTTYGDTFVFKIVRAGAGYEALIESQPSYGWLRDSSAHATHRLPDGSRSGGMKVCFKKQPQDVRTAVTLALWWADCTSRYIHTGAAFN